MPHSARLQDGCLHLYTGQGKGATAAALGLVFRAVGHNFRVTAILFLKGNLEYGEQETARRLAPFVQMRAMGREVTVDPSNPEQIDVKWAQDGWRLAEKVMNEQRVDMLVLDELTTAIDLGLLDLKQVVAGLSLRPANMEIVVTGRVAPPELVEIADVVTDLRRIKHYRDSGRPPRPGIDS